MELRQFVDVIWTRLWLVVLATALVAGMTLILSLTTTPIYQAITTLEIDPGGDPRTDLYSVVRTSEMVAGTYVEQIRAPVLLRRVVERKGATRAHQDQQRWPIARDLPPSCSMLLRRSVW